VSDPQGVTGEQMLRALIKQLEAALTTSRAVLASIAAVQVPTEAPTGPTTMGQDDPDE